MTKTENFNVEARSDVPSGIDRTAPVIAHHKIDINAPLTRVWNLHHDVNAWPTWQSDITEAQLHGDFTPDGSQTNESFSGKPVEQDPSLLKQQLDGSLVSWMKHLKAAAGA